VIRGWFASSTPFSMPLVRVALWLDGISFTWIDVNFVVDTGAAVTCLHPRGAAQVGIPRTLLIDPSRWTNVVHLSGVGGDVSYYPTPVWYRFRHADGTLQHIESTINVASWRPDNQTLPSLLGRDILSQFRVTLDWPQGTVELEAPA